MNVKLIKSWIQSLMTILLLAQGGPASGEFSDELIDAICTCKAEFIDVMQAVDRSSKSYSMQEALSEAVAS